MLASAMLGRPVRRLYRSHAPAGGSLVAGFATQAATAVSGTAAARLLGVTGRGYYALLGLFPVICTLLGTIGLPQAVTFAIARDPRCFRGLVQQWRTFALHVFLLTLVDALVVLAYAWDRPGVLLRAGLVGALLVPAFAGQQFSLAILQGRGQFGRLSRLRPTAVGLYAAAMVGLFAFDVHDLFVVMVAFTTANLAASAILVRAAIRGWREEPPDCESPTYRELLRYGSRAILGSASPVDALNVDQMVVGLFVSPHALGLYVAAYAFTNLPTTAAASIGLIAFPRVAGAGSPTEAREQIRSYLVLTVAVTAAIVIPLEVVGGPLLRVFFGDAFGSADSTLRILLVGTLFYAGRRLLIDAANGLGRPHLGSLSEIVSLLSLLATMPILVTRWGLNGAALSVALATAVSLLAFLPLLTRRDAEDNETHPGAATRVNNP